MHTYTHTHTQHRVLHMHVHARFHNTQCIHNVILANAYALYRYVARGFVVASNICVCVCFGGHDFTRQASHWRLDTRLLQSFKD